VSRKIHRLAKDLKRPQHYPFLSSLFMNPIHFGLIEIDHLFEEPKKFVNISEDWCCLDERIGKETFRTDADLYCHTLDEVARCIVSIKEVPVKFRKYV
jgi:hypothetical protein